MTRSEQFCASGIPTPMAPCRRWRVPAGTASRRIDAGRASCGGSSAAAGRSSKRGSRAARRCGTTRSRAGTRTDSGPCRSASNRICRSISSILMLGTNDLKHRFAASASDIADSIEVLVKTIQRSEAGPAGAAPAVMVVAPPPMQEVDWLGRDVPRRGGEVAATRPALARRGAGGVGAAFFDAGRGRRIEHRRWHPPR